MADPIKVKKKGKKETPAEKKARIAAEIAAKKKENEKAKAEKAERLAEGQRRTEVTKEVTREVNKNLSESRADYQKGRNSKTKAQLEEAKAMQKDKSLFSQTVVGNMDAEERAGVRDAARSGKKRGESKKKFSKGGKTPTAKSGMRIKKKGC